MADDGLWTKLEHTWPARVAQGLWQGLTLPGDVAQGNLPMWGEDGHTNMQAINRSADLAGSVTLGAGGLPAEVNALRAGAAFKKIPQKTETIGPAATNVEGKIFAGKNHTETTEAAAKAKNMDFDEFIDKHTDDQVQHGFLTSTGRFVDRDEALSIARKNDQLKTGPEVEWWADGQKVPLLPGGLVAEVLK
jgi:hypothetical protein